MRTRRPEIPEGLLWQGRATMRTGSFGLVNPSVLLEHRLGKTAAGSLSAEYIYTTGRYKFRYRQEDGYDFTDTRRNGDVEAARVEYGVYGEMEGGEWQAKVYYYHSDRGLPGAAVREAGVYTHEDRQWDDSFFAQGNVMRHFGRYSLQVKGKYAYDYLHYLSDPRLDVTTMYVNNHYRQQEAYASVANLVAITPWWSADVSVDFQWNKLNADLTNFVYPRRYTGLVAVATSLYWDRLRVQASVLGTFVHERTRVESATAGDKQEWTPTVAVAWLPLRGEELTVRAFYKRIFRMPTLNDLYYTFIGNANLDPEYTTQYNFGLAYGRTCGGRLRRIEAQVDVYYNEVEDKIVAVPTSNQFRWTMMNLGFVEIQGVDVSLQTGWQFGQDFWAQLRTTYTYEKAQDFTNPADTYYGGQIPYIPWHSASAVLNASWRAWDLNYSFIYTGERYESSANIPENYAKPWYTSDLSLGWRQQWGRTAWRLTAEVNNVFNQQYEVVQWYPMPGTNARVRIEVNF